jgi:hypothetical protein
VFFDARPPYPQAGELNSLKSRNLSSVLESLNSWISKRKYPEAFALYKVLAPQLPSQSTGELILGLIEQSMIKEAISLITPGVSRDIVMQAVQKLSTPSTCDSAVQLLMQMNEKIDAFPQLKKILEVRSVQPFVNDLPEFQVCDIYKSFPHLLAIAIELLIAKHKDTDKKSLADVCSVATTHGMLVPGVLTKSSLDKLREVKPTAENPLQTLDSFGTVF